MKVKKKVLEWPAMRLEIGKEKEFVYFCNSPNIQLRNGMVMYLHGLVFDRWRTVKLGQLAIKMHGDKANLYNDTHFEEVLE